MTRRQKPFLLGMAKDYSGRCPHKMARPFAATTLMRIYCDKLRRLWDTGLFSGWGVSLFEGDARLLRQAKASDVPLLLKPDRTEPGPLPLTSEFAFMKEIAADDIFWVNGSLPMLGLATVQGAAELFARDWTCVAMTAVGLARNWFWNPTTHKPINNTDPRCGSTQLCPPLLESVHAFHGYPRERAFQEGVVWTYESPNDPRLFLIEDPREVLDIDTLVDFARVEAAYREAGAQPKSPGAMFEEHLIVSCQDNTDWMSNMVMAGGARAVRVAGADTVRLVRAKDTTVSIIACKKIDLASYQIRITPTLEAARELCDAGADVVAFDATMRSRPVSIEAMVEAIHSGGAHAMADVGTLADAVNAERCGADYVATTLADKLDMALIAEIAARVHLPLAAEGGIRSPEQAMLCLQAGADYVVVGSAITRPHLITKWFKDAVEGTAT